MTVYLTVYLYDVIFVRIVIMGHFRSLKSTRKDLAFQYNATNHPHSSYQPRPSKAVIAFNCSIVLVPAAPGSPLSLIIISTKVVKNEGRDVATF